MTNAPTNNSSSRGSSSSSHSTISYQFTQSTNRDSSRSLSFSNAVYTNSCTFTSENFSSRYTKLSKPGNHITNGSNRGYGLSCTKLNCTVLSKCSSRIVTLIKDEVTSSH